MVESTKKIVNGEVVDTSKPTGSRSTVNDGVLSKKPTGFIDSIAEFFWSIFSIFLMFFQTIWMPKGGQHKPTMGQQRIRGLKPGGTFKFRGGG